MISFSEEESQLAKDYKETMETYDDGKTRKQIAEKNKKMENMIYEMEKKFFYVRPETVCMVMRSYISVFPSFSPMRTGFKSIFYDNSGSMPKSFRTIGIDVVEAISPLINEVAGPFLVYDLRKELSFFYDNFILGMNIKTIPPEKKNKTQEKLNNLLTTKKQLLTQMNQITENIQAYTDEIDQVVERLKKSQYKDKKLSLKIMVLEQELGIIETIQNYQNIDQINQVLIQKWGLDMSFLKLKYFLYFLEKIKLNLDVIQVFKEGYPQLESLKITNEDELLQLENCQYEFELLLTDSQTKVDAAKSEIKSVFSAEIDNLYKEYNKNTDLTLYKQLFDNLVEENKKQIELRTEMIKNSSKISQMGRFIRENKIVKVKKPIDFIISAEEKERITNKYESMKSLVQEYNLDLGESNFNEEYENKENQKIFKSENSKIKEEDEEIDEFSAKYFAEQGNAINFGKFIIMKFQRDFKDFETNPVPSTVPIIDFLDSNKKELESLDQLYKENLDLIQSVYNKAKSQYESMRKIEDLNKEIDLILAKIFFLIYKVNEDEYCFIPSVLSYHFFNMIKTNIITQNYEFIDTFLSMVANEYPREAKRFILISYSVFVEPAYLSKVSLKLARNFETVEEEKNNIDIQIGHFATNFVMIVENYKDNTDYALDLQERSSSMLSKLTRHILRGITSVIQKFLWHLRSGTLKMGIGILFEIVLDSILSALGIATACGPCIIAMKNFVIRTCMKVFNYLHFVLKAKFIKFGKMISDIKAKLNDFSNEIIYVDSDLTHLDKLIAKENHEESVEKQDQKDGQAESSASISDMEKLFHDAATSSTIYNKISETKLFTVEFEIQNYFMNKVENSEPQAISERILTAEQINFIDNQNQEQDTSDSSAHKMALHQVRSRLLIK